MGINLTRLFGDAKISHFGNQVFIKQDVGGFHISVYNRRILDSIWIQIVELTLACQ